MLVKSFETTSYTRKKRDFKTWTLDNFPVPESVLSFRIILFVVVDDENNSDNKDDDDGILLRE